MNQTQSNRITAFYVENFKAIRKGTWFDLNNLNILTGANSSGKSTLFNAMKIFTEGFVDGDFPLIDLKRTLPENGDLDSIRNFYSNEDHFKVGFRFYSEFYGCSFDVIYTFGIPYFSNHRNGKTEFISLFIYKRKDLLLEIHSSPFYTSDGEESNLDSKYGFEYYPIIPDNPGEFIFNIKLDILRQILPKETEIDYNPIMDQLYQQFGNNWCGEVLEEESYVSRKHYLRLSEEFIFDLFKDTFCNLTNRLNKEAIFEDDSYLFEQYSTIKEELGYGDFIIATFKQLFSEISGHLRFFFNKRLYHLNLVDDLQKRIIHTDKLNFDIANLTKENKIKLSEPHSGLLRYFHLDGVHENMYSWLEVFDLKGYIITEKLDNGYFIIKYVDEEDNEINIADLGKGHAKLIQLILAIGYKLFLMSDEDSGKRKLNSTERQTIIHIEEPEAYLHPKWQSLLADFFMKLTKDHNVQFLIETHSVYLIQKLQLLVARKEIKPEDVSLLYFEQAKKDVTFRKINIRRDGLLKESFGDGFYDESAHLALALIDPNNQN